eukprot:TRINITY_DN16440_c0_g1_i1.p1 TRINITY_DN16440_c0_g1~~TRINITY_DN16440_c0_g1_i1.p1  ORF type:complete len:248 (+),score=63.06 TRINITY_DN16440_c0_g1_i1:34-777(+)
MGIDCFGRNTFGGGGFTCNVAQEVINKNGVSTALFAPGWTLEGMGEGEDFETRQSLFWELIGEADAGEKRKRKRMGGWQSTSFCRGTGKMLWIEGKLERECRWLDFGLADVSYPLNEIGVGVEWRDDVAWNGDRCLRMRGGADGVADVFGGCLWHEIGKGEGEQVELEVVFFVEENMERVGEVTVMLESGKELKIELATRNDCDEVNGWKVFRVGLEEIEDGDVVVAVGIAIGQVDVFVGSVGFGVK